ncbi:MAG: phenylalanine--tRNA ligase subunit beta [Candidatus Aerophobetes bacterium]|nr:phenylalanine--tRNA ligase subunit beta [Candidatus Aerophobetes bacterium]
MRVSYKYLKQMVDFSFSPEELAEHLTNLGLEVREIQPIGKLEKIVVGEITSIRNHPHTDKLKVVEVNIGEDKLSLVCGAPNIKEGLFVPVALEGAILKNGVKLRKTEIRGVTSPAMLCSEEELGLGEDRSGIMILPSSLPLGENLSRALDIEDIIFDLEITPDRADCLSMIGVAREISALAGAKLSSPFYKLDERKEKKSKAIEIEIEAPDLCPYYTTQLIRNVSIGPSPLWLQQSVLASGAKSINNVVDITNYVLWEMGQPLHAFDYHLIASQKIVVRRAKRDEVLISLDGLERQLDESMLLIADSDKAIALGGIIGGENTQVQNYTRDILLEAAYFNPLSIRQTSRKIGLSTEASYRFERGVDPLGVKKASNRAAFLIQKLAGGEIEGDIIEKGEPPKEKKKIFFRPRQARHILGSPVPSSTMNRILRRLQFGIEKGKKGWEVAVPSFRQDVNREIDLIEEIGRFYGYDKIEATLPSLSTGEPRESFDEQTRKKVREILQGLGFYEVVGAALSEEDIFNKTNLSLAEGIRVRNPLSKQQEILMNHLFPHLLTIASYNINQGIKRIRIFELANVFKNGSSLKEGTFLSGLILEEDFDFLCLKGIGETLLEGLHIDKVQFVRCDCPYLSSKERLAIKKKGKSLGVLGKLPRKVNDNFELPLPSYIFEFDFYNLLSFCTQKRRISPPPKFPSIQRDLSILVKGEIPAEKIRESIIDAGGKWMEEVKLFDVYRGKSIPSGYKSLAYSLTFRHPKKTLKDKEVDKIQQNIINLLERRLGAHLRRRKPKLTNKK